MNYQYRQHQQTLSHYQRFYYNNYEYYNEFQKLDDYHNDISKLRFNNSRRSTTSIVLYDTLSCNYEDESEHQAKPLVPKITSHSHLITQHIPKTVEDFLYQFAATYHEHNYSSSKPERADLPKSHQIIILYFYMHSLLEEFAKTGEEDHRILGSILQRLKGQSLQRRALIESSFGEECQNRQESNELLERWFSFEQYANYLITTTLQVQNKEGEENQDNGGKIQNFYLLQYCQYFRWLLSDIAHGNKRSLLLSALPYTPVASNIFHPLTIPLQFCLSADTTSPKIIFLNLDGRQTYYNIRAIKQLPKEVRYISIFNQPSGSQMVNSNLQNVCEEFQVEASYANLNLAHSQLIFRQLRLKDMNGSVQPHHDNILLYPLNSVYLRRSCMKNCGQALPKLQASSDIRWLWQERIAGQVQQWSPQLIIVSYNGDLDIAEQDFEAIIRDLTILSDHRIILFTNLSGLYKRQEEETKDDSEEWQVSKVKMIEQFMAKYREYSYDKVNEERFFNNMAYFIKCSSGNASLQVDERNKPLQKYSLPRRMQYLERLSQLQQFQDWIAPTLRGLSLSNLFQGFSSREKKQNQKQNQPWQRLIDQVLASLKTKPPQPIEVQEGRSVSQIYHQISEKQIYYRLREIQANFAEEERSIRGDYQATGATDLEDYLLRNRERLVLENLERCRYRRAYVSEEQQQGSVKFYRFCFQDQDELLLQKYSQIIINQRKLRVFIINYKAQEGHRILYGDINDRSSLVKVQKINSRLQEEIQGLDLENKQEVLRINYSYCFVKDKLYLFWPQEWYPKEYIRRKLLGLDYKPPHINEMVQIQYNYQERCYFIERLRWKGPQNGIESLPRKGCTAIESEDGSRFYIFGGIYDSHLDYYMATSTICEAEVSSGCFTINQLPKRKDQHLNRPNFLKPKMAYKIERNTIKTSQQKMSTVILTGGYGRNFTNNHSLQSYESFNIHFQFEGGKITQNTHNNYRIVRLQHPIEKNMIGRYIVGVQGEEQDKFSENIQDWIAAERRLEKGQPPQVEREVITVLEDDLRVYDMKINHKRQYLFGWDRTIRQKIYVPHCWSPQLQILLNGRLFIVNAALRAQKTNNYISIGHYVIPKEQDLISICLEEDRLWILASSPILKSLQNKNSFKLYEGSLSNLYHLLNKKQLPMNERYEFKHSSHTSLLQKTLYALDERIYLLGGLPCDSNQNQFRNHREDFILQKVKDKFKQRVRKLECLECTLELPNPFVIKHRDQILLYAVGMEQRKIDTGKEGQVKIEELWLLKIQTLTANEAAQEEFLMRAPLRIYHYDWQKMTIVLRRTTLIDPKIVKIIKYTRFSYALLRQYSQKALSILSRQLPNDIPYQYLSMLTVFSTEQSNQVLDSLIVQNHHKNNILQHLLREYRQIIESKGQAQGIDSQEFIKILRSLFRLMNKRLIECIAQNTEQQLYQIVLEDSSSRKVKYIALGQLKSTQLRFLRVRYKQELAICLNETTEEELFFHSNALQSQEIVEERTKGSVLELQEEKEQIFRINLSFK